MSRPSAEYEAGIAEEVASWPGAGVMFEHGGKHMRAVLTYADTSRFVVFPSSPGDGRRGLLNSLGVVRRELASLGAMRSEDARSERQASWCNPGADLREMPAGEPAPVMPDPWAALQPLVKAPAGPVYHTAYEQGSQQWLDARCGLLTASEMRLVLTPTLKLADNDKVRAHIYELAAQRITRFVEPQFDSYDMLRGKADEDEARALYADRYAPVAQTGFITNDRWGFTLGYSPDGLVGDHGLIECKSRKQKYQVQTVVEYASTGGIPVDFVMQCQTGLLVSERQWLDFISFSAKLPMAVIRVYPDDKMQAAILEAAAAAEARIAGIIEQFQSATSLKEAA